MSRDPTDLELLLVLAAGGSITIPQAMARDARPVHLRWTVRDEPNGDRTYSVVRSDIREIEGEVIGRPRRLPASPFDPGL